MVRLALSARSRAQRAENRRVWAARERVAAFGQDAVAAVRDILRCRDDITEAVSLSFGPLYVRALSEREHELHLGCRYVPLRRRETAPLTVEDPHAPRIVACVTLPDHPTSFDGMRFEPRERLLLPTSASLVEDVHVEVCGDYGPELRAGLLDLRELLARERAARAERQERAADARLYADAERRGSLTCHADRLLERL